MDPLRPIRALIQLILDRAAARRMETDAKKSLGAVETSIGLVKKAAIAAGGAIAALFALRAIKDFIVEVATLAARYETLGVVLHQVGANAGYTAKQVDETSKALQKTGITMLESRQSISALIAANIDLSKATDLARIAQNAAQIAGINSSEAFNSLVEGISNAEVVQLRNMNLMANFQLAYKRYAQENHTTTAALTERQKAEARLNEVLRVGAGVTGAYTASMNTAGKQMLSTQRLVQDLKVKIGNLFLPAYQRAVEDYTVALQGAGTEMDNLQDAEGFENTQRAIRGLVGTVVGMTLVVKNFVEGTLDLILALFAGAVEGVERLLNGVTKGINWMLPAFNAITGLNVKQLQTYDAQIESLARSRRAAMAEFAGDMADMNRAVENIKKSWTDPVEIHPVTDTPKPPPVVPAPVDAEAARKARQAEVALLKQASDLGILTLKDQQRAHDLYLQTNTALEAGNLSLERRVELTQQLTDLGGVRSIYNVIPMAEAAPFVRGDQELANVNPYASHAGKTVLSPIKLPDEEELGAFESIYTSMLLHVTEVSETGASVISSAFHDAFTMMIRDGVTVGNFFEGLGRGLAGSMLQGLSDYAQGKVAENLAAAIEAGAYALGFSSHGNFASAGAAWSSAAEHAAAAVAWGAASGGASAIGSAASGHGGGMMPGRGQGGAESERFEPGGPIIKIYFDPLNPSDPRYQLLHAATHQEVEQIFGKGADIQWYPASGSGGKDK